MLGAVRFVHLAPASRVRAVLRGGIGGAASVVTIDDAEVSVRRAVFAMPVVPDYGTTFQWTREMRRVHGERVTAIHFRIHDDETVYVGRYGKSHSALHAAKAAAWVAKNPTGTEVVVPRRIAANEIVATREIDQRVGWAESPETDGRLSCVCQVCLASGDRKFVRRVRAAAMEAFDAAKRAESIDELVRALGSLDLPLERAADRVETKALFAYAEHAEPRVRKATTWLLGHLRHDPRAFECLLRMTSDDDPATRSRAVESLTHIAKLLPLAKAFETMPESTALELLALFDVCSCSEDSVAALEWLMRRESDAIRKAGRERAKALLGDAPASRLERRLHALLD